MRAPETPAERVGFGAQLREARKARGWSQAEAGRHIGVHGSTVSSMEQACLCSDETLTRAARLFGLEVKEKATPPPATEAVTEAVTDELWRILCELAPKERASDGPMGLVLALERALRKAQAGERRWAAAANRRGVSGRRPKEPETKAGQEANDRWKALAVPNEHVDVHRARYAVEQAGEQPRLPLAVRDHILDAAQALRMTRWLRSVGVTPEDQAA